MYKDYLNPYTVVLLIAYIGTTFAMQYEAASFSLQGFVLVSPLIAGMVLFSGRLKQAKRQGIELRFDENLLERDVFLISYSFLLAALISAMTQYDSSDARAWWGIGVYFETGIGIIFALFFAHFNQFKRYHKGYTNIFSMLVIAVSSSYELWPAYIDIKFIGKISSAWVTLFLLGFLHLLCFFVHKAYEMFFEVRGGMLK